MTFGEGFMLLVRWFHAMAAVAWIGGSIFYVLVLRPAQRRAGVNGEAITPEVTTQFRGLVDSCIAVLLVTGTVMLFDRLTDSTTGTIYVATVSIKIVCVVDVRDGAAQVVEASSGDRPNGIYSERPARRADPDYGLFVGRQPDRDPGSSHFLPVRPAQVHL